MSVRWLVDGMNVIGSRPDGWWKDRHAATARLVRMLERFAVSTGDEVTVVLEQPPAPPIQSAVVTIAHAPRPGRDAADREIVRRLHTEERPESVAVVTSDVALADEVKAAGASVQPAAKFRARIESL